jgi:hypothetical protein
MKLFTGCVISAGLVLTAPAANAQILAPSEIGNSRYSVATDIDGPYAAMPPEAPPSRYAPPPRYYGGPRLLPPTEVYTVVREGGFSPRGTPQQRGFVYTISVTDRRGHDGRLVIDARNGRIVRFMPGYRMGDRYEEGPPPISGLRGPPRPPGSIPHIASRTPPVPKPSPLAASPAPEPAQQSAAVQAKPADAQAVPQGAPPPVVEAKPAAPEIQPTQEMPKVQGLE